jgi:hypothetical protein
MKKIYSFLMVSAIAMTANAQLVINENFTNYTNGFLNGQGGWVSQGGGNNIVVVSTSNPLTYPGYSSGFHHITTNDVTGRDPYKPFSTPILTNASKTIFMSFVVNVNDVEENTGVYTLALRDSSSTAANTPCRFYIEEQNGGSDDIQFGIALGSGTPQFTTTAGNFEKDETHLIVIRYDIVSGGTDRAYLWVDPITASEPTVGASNTTNFALSLTGEVTYGTEWNALQIFDSGGDTPEAFFDAFRVAVGDNSAIAWSTLSPVGAPLPVQLTSFNASEETFGTKLVWNTAEESGIVSYVVERSTDGKNFTAIGTVKAANLRSYSFTDAQPADNNYYRLKMVELDGTFKYSFIISLKAKLTTNISVSPNPVKNMVMIQHPKAGAAGHIQIISATGQMIRDIRLSANAVISNVDMSGLTSGLYHVVFKNGSDIFSKTILKQ